ncbi:sentrin-specific protease 5-like [Citrus clementina]|uniref:sentrin-specific protease 5-like n=1 Tax=Citrus clementina TaxID=85681 RepID=UPI000CED2C08|nr:sentrin-specific protease 5-like [Citrus x clementina]
MVSRMEILDPQQLLLFPYNTSKHWMLIVVDPHKFIVYFFDSLGHEPRPNLKNFVSLAFKIFVAKMGNANRKSFVWKRVKCPQQTTNVECGYYVMRFMKEIIENQFVGRDNFTQKDIDKVRVEWAEYIWQNIFR